MQNNSFAEIKRALPLLVCLGILLSACSPVMQEEIPTSTPSSTLPATIQPETEAPTEEPSPTVTSSPFRSELPDPESVTWSTVVSGLDQPVDIQNANDGSGRLFVVEKPGRIRIISNFLILPDPFLDIRGRVGAIGLEQGLLGLAFHPDFDQNGYFYVNYTDLFGNSVISRFQISSDDPNRADQQSEAVLLRVDQPFANHNGGGLAFGPENQLYIGLGDGGSGGDPYGNGQNPDTYLGKLLRLDIDMPDAVPEIWASGLRNPWRFSFDRANGDLYIADVGQGDWEEINYVPAGTRPGLNFGWNFFEGNHPYTGQPPADATFIQPVAEYSHADGCSVTGGYVYRGQDLPNWQGVYFYADYCNGNVFGLTRTSEEAWLSSVLFRTTAQVTTFGVDENGELYLANFGAGTLLRLGNR